MLIWRGHRAKVRSLAFSPDGRFLATTSGTSRFVWLWNPTTGKIVRKLSGSNRSARVAAFFPDGKHVAATQWWPGGGWICDVETGATVAGFQREGQDPDLLAVSPDGARLLAGNSAAVAVWDLPLAQPSVEHRQADHTIPMRLRGTPRIGFSPKGTYFCGAEWLMHLCDPVTLAVRRTLSAPVGDASAATFAFTLDEERLVVAFGFGAAVWRVGEWETKPVRIAGHGNLVRAVGFLPGGATVLTAAMDGTVRLWDSSTGAETRSFDWGIGKVQAAAVSPDGTMCAAGGDDGHLVVWDVDA
jgi:WD40 repeat protein